MIDRIKIPSDWQVKKLDDLIEAAIGGDWGKDPNHVDQLYSLAYCIRGSEMKNWDGTSRFPRRKLEHIEVPYGADEKRHGVLAEYVHSRLAA